MTSIDKVDSQGLYRFITDNLKEEGNFVMELLNLSLFGWMCSDNGVE